MCLFYWWLLESVAPLVCSWEEVSSRSFCAAILSPEDPQAMWTFLFLLASLNRFYGFSSSYHLTSALFCLLVSWLLSVNPLLLSSSSRAFRSHVWIYLEPRPPSLTPLFWLQELIITILAQTQSWEEKCFKKSTRMANAHSIPVPLPLRNKNDQLTCVEYCIYNPALEKAVWDDSETHSLHLKSSSSQEGYKMF